MFVASSVMTPCWLSLVNCGLRGTCLSPPFPRRHPRNRLRDWRRRRQGTRHPCSTGSFHVSLILHLFILPFYMTQSSSESISSSGHRCPDAFAKLMPVLCHSACCCHRTKYIYDVFLPSLSWLSSATFPCYHSRQYCLLWTTVSSDVAKVFKFLMSFKIVPPVHW